MKVYSIPSGDANNKLSIAYAMKQGYQIVLDTDGSAEIHNGKGETYLVANWVCDCLDSMARNGGSYEKPDGTPFCKHVTWVSQVYPCVNCQATMLLNSIGSTGGIRFYACHNCKAIKAVALVKSEREQERSKQNEIAEMIKAGEEASRLVFGD